MKSTRALGAAVLAAAALQAPRLVAAQIFELGVSAPLVYGIATDQLGRIWYSQGTKLHAVGYGGGDAPLLGATLLKQVAIGPDGSARATEPAANKVWRYFPNGNTAFYTPPTGGSEPTGITVGPDG